MKKVDLVQGSVEWHAFRKMGIGASDAPIVMGISPYKTPRELWMEKTGQGNFNEEEGKEFIFAKGHRTEAKIRKEYYDLTGVEMIPVCLVHPKVDYFRASLDGFDSKRGILEAKLVGAKVLEDARKGIIPPHHFAQMQHQFMVSGAKVGDWFGHNGKDSGILLTIEPDLEYIKRMEEAEHEFWRLVVEKIMPSLTTNDYLVPINPDEINLMKELKEAKEWAENAKISFEDLKERVLSKIKHPKISCEGLRIIKVESRGSIDYSKIPEIQNLSEEYLEKFRKESNTSWRVEFEKLKKVAT